MPLDPAARALLDQMIAAGQPPLNELEPPEARKAFDELWKALMEAEPVAKVEDRTIPGPAGKLPIRIYTPEGSPPYPILVYFHGGGWVVGNCDTYSPTCRAIVNASRCMLVVPEYRLAPEHKFPAAVEDCYAAAKWVGENAAALGGDPKRVAIGGDSAGGNLAAVISHLARDKGVPRLAFQLLIYPATEAAMNTPSALNSTEYFLTDKMMHWFWDHYVTSSADKANPQVSPLRYANFKGLPPALVITAEFDPLRDEGEQYADKLRQAGVDAKTIRYDGQIHGFYSMGNVFTLAKDAIKKSGEALRAAFGI